MNLFRTGLRLLCAVLACSLAASGNAAERKPNILFILTDDEGWPTLSSYGNKLVSTPNLDRLAAEGMRFTDAYVMPQCTPTRAALLTGQHTARNGMWHVIGWYGYPWARMREPMFRENLPRDTFTLATGLKSAGYTTACLGKWHLTNNEDGNYVGLKQEGAKHYGFDFAPPPPSPRYHQEGDKGVDWLTDQAGAFMEKHRDHPWFIYLAHHTLHGPVVAPLDLVQKYRSAGAPETGLHNATYLAAIEHMDRSIGRLMAKVAELKLTEQTIVVFLSDNGGVYQIYNADPFSEAKGAKPPTPTQLTVGTEEFSNAPLRAGKGSHYEGGIRVPCVVRWPGQVKPASVNHTPIHVVDWMPTLFEAAGVKPPAGQIMDGASLLPLLRGGSLPDRPLYWYLPLYEVRWGGTPSAIIREGDWKLIEFFGDWFDPQGRLVPGARLELYNLRQDISETRNLATEEKAIAKRLQNKLRNWMASIPAEVPTANPNFDPDRQLLETRNKPK